MGNKLGRRRIHEAPTERQISIGKMWSNNDAILPDQVGCLRFDWFLLTFLTCMCVYSLWVCVCVCFNGSFWSCLLWTLSLIFFIANVSPKQGQSTLTTVVILVRTYRIKGSIKKEYWSSICKGSMINHVSHWVKSIYLAFGLTDYDKTLKSTFPA